MIILLIWLKFRKFKFIYINIFFKNQSKLEEKFLQNHKYG